MEKICKRFNEIQAKANQNPNPILDKLVKSTVQKYQIDESHGLQHHRNVAYFVQLLFPKPTEFDDLEELKRQEELAIICAYVHDLVDSKYRAENNLPTVLEFLKTECHLTENELDIVSFVITHVSFSKRRVNLEAGQSEFGTKDPLRIQLCSIVADADMLDAYDPRRAEKYQATKFSYLNDDRERRFEIISWTRTIFEKRVLQYLSTWLRTETAKELAIPFHSEAQEYCKKHYAEGELRDY